MAMKRPQDEETKREQSEAKKYHMEVDISGIMKEVPDEHDLVNRLADISNNWYEIGLGLKVSHDVLDGLKNKEDTNIYKLSKVIHAWITSTESHLLSWETVITVIEGPLVTNKRKADEIHDYLATEVKKKRGNKTEMDYKLEQIFDQDFSQAEYTQGLIMWPWESADTEVILNTPTVKECEKVIDDLAKLQPNGKQWSIRLNASNPASTRVIIRNLYKCSVDGLMITLATPYCISALSEILPTNNMLKTLNLSLYPNTPNVIKEMSSSLCTNTSLEVLLFSSLDVTEEDSVYLSKVLAVNKTLRVLRFSHCNITDKNFKYICEGLTKNCTLNTFEIKQNPQITSESTDTIVTLLKTTTSLAELVLLKNSLTSADVSVIVNTLISNIKTKLFMSIEHEESCKELDCYELVKDRVKFVW